MDWTDPGGEFPGEWSRPLAGVCLTVVGLAAAAVPARRGFAYSADRSACSYAPASLMAESLIVLWPCSASPSSPVASTSFATNSISFAFLSAV